MHLQILIEHTFPDIQLTYKWRLPCYYLGTRPICYLNKSKDFVDVGFWHASHLTEYASQLISENRKVVRSLRYKHLDAIDDAIFIEILKKVEGFKNTSFLE
ncbi:DUF1801 domain-containing protein [Psychroserpens sp.]|uniref:DUF1801 domain-containing protein n=1 Tax=Psychroserpens sp. TaxID=2020870 RepID=UPI003C76C965